MRKLEIVFGITAILSLIMRLLLMPYASLLVLVSFFGLAFIYFPFFSFSINQIKSKKTALEESRQDRINNKAVIAVSGIALSILSVGIVFKVMHMPGASINLSIGLILSAFSIIVLFLKKNKTELNKRIIVRIVLLGCLGLILFSVPESVTIKIQFRNYPEFIELYEQAEKNTEDKVLKEKVDLEYHRLTMPKEEFEYYKTIERKKTLPNKPQ